MSIKHSKICAFDIGIKNLAFCVFDCVGKRPLAWKNVNILPDSEKTDGVPQCFQCKNKSKYSLPSGKSSCKKHLGTVEIIPGGETKLPLVAELKNIVKNASLTIKGASSKENLIETLKTKYALPIIVMKKKAATSQPLSVLHDGILKMIEDNWAVFQTVELFALENQPVLKNPTMKTVQILLYASLRTAFISRGLKPAAVELVHAGKKVKGTTTGDAGYSDRKAGSEERATTWLTSNAASWLPTITEAKKKSDLADALCMCLDLAASTN